jgi:hypothetical protein
MTRVGFEPTTPVFERAKAVHVLDRAVTVIGKRINIIDTNWQVFTEPAMNVMPPRTRKITQKLLIWKWQLAHHCDMDPISAWWHLGLQVVILRNIRMHHGKV